ncbi:MAG: hypothetical protein ABH821_05350 [archaeon]
MVKNIGWGIVILFAVIFGLDGFNITGWQSVLPRFILASIETFWPVALGIIAIVYLLKR